MEVRKPRVVWITGASSGIGKALAELFASNGDDVVASARTESELKLLKRKISDAGYKCKSIKCDVQDEVSVATAADEILSSYKHVDILINNAGVTSFKDFLGTSIKEFDNVINTNLRGVFLITKSILPNMLDRGIGLIINILSYTAKEIYTNSSAYSASKAGAEAMMNVLRAEVRSQGINIVNVYPGAVSTPIWNARQVEKYGHRMLLPLQVAEMIYQISVQHPTLMVEEIVLRPQGGDLKD